MLEPAGCHEYCNALGDDELGVVGVPPPLEHAVSESATTNPARHLAVLMDPLSGNVLKRSGEPYSVSCKIILTPKSSCSYASLVELAPTSSRVADLEGLGHQTKSIV